MPPPASISVLPAWITAEVMADTRAVWEPIYDRPLADSELIEILLNSAGVLRILFGLSTPPTTAFVAAPKPQCRPRRSRKTPARAVEQ